MSSLTYSYSRSIHFYIQLEKKLLAAFKGVYSHQYYTLLLLSLLIIFHLVTSIFKLSFIYIFFFSYSNFLPQLFFSNFLSTVSTFIFEFFFSCYIDEKHCLLEIRTAKREILTRSQSRRRYTCTWQWRRDRCPQTA